MATESLPLFPFIGISQSYGVDPAEMFQREELDGGFSRKRLHIVGGASVVTVRFLLQGFEVQVFREFYRYRLAEGALPFRASLILDGPELEVYDATFTKPWRLVDLPGHALHMIATEMEVIPDPVVSDTAVAVLDWYDELGAQAPQLLAALDDLVNVFGPSLQSFSI